MEDASHAEESWRRSYGGGVLEEDHRGGMEEESWRWHLGGVMEENNTCTYMYGVGGRSCK
tara:strand:- start:84 stop:263 length:180 start_codon:yes stop_codon:yes gene_type:complete